MEAGWGVGPFLPSLQQDTEGLFRGNLKAEESSIKMVDDPPFPKRINAEFKTESVFKHGQIYLIAQSHLGDQIQGFPL